jgi:MHS family proline/betaine transporter-like MFS transporter
VAALTVSLMSEAELQSWGWRIPFLVGAALAGAVWLARSTMDESPDFERLRDAGTLALNPLAHAVSRQRAALLRAFAISALGSITYYVGITYVPAFLTSVGLDGRGGFAVAVDHRGGRGDRGHARRRAAVGPLRPQARAGRAGGAQRGAAGHAVHAAGRRLAGTALLGAVVLALVAGGVSAVGAIATGEQFTEESRASGLGLGYTLATAIFGGLTPYVAQRLVEATGAPQMPGVMIALVASRCCRCSCDARDRAARLGRDSGFRRPSARRPGPRARSAAPTTAELAGHADLDQLRTEAFARLALGRRCRRARPSAAAAVALVGDRQVDRAVLARQRAVLGRIGRQLVEHQRQRRRRARGDRRVVAVHRDARVAAVP